MRSKGAKMDQTKNANVKSPADTASAFTQEQITRIVDSVIQNRRSIRAYLQKPVPHKLIEELLSVAARAPSGTNTQPWQVYVLSGKAKDDLSKEIVAAFLDASQSEHHKEEYNYYPHQWVEPYISRRRKVGWDLYGLLGIAKTDKERMQQQQARNYTFFDAPVGLIFTIDRIMEKGSWLDYGMFMQNVMIAAKARGLDTCPQASFTPYHRIIAKHLKLKPEQQLICGMSLGYADDTKIENTLVTEREPVNSFTTFLD
jgi:nitroreductase